MRILLAELAPARGRPAENIGRVERLTAAGRADLVVFPELFVSGYRIGDRAHQLALASGSPELQRLSQAARAGATAIAIGAPRRRAGPAGEIENAALLFRPDGTISAQAKRYLPTYGPFEEGKVYSPTPTSRPVSLGGVAIGMAICYDAFFPEVFRDLAAAGAELFVVISAAPVTSRRLFDKVLPARAVENATPLIYVNRVGVEDGLVFGGGSVALDVRGEPLAEETVAAELAEGERVVRVEVDTAEAARWRPFRPVLRDRARGAAAHPSTPTSDL